MPVPRRPGALEDVGVPPLLLLTILLWIITQHTLVRCAPGGGVGFFFTVRADPVLRRGRVVVVLARRGHALLVVGEFGVLDRQMAARVGPRVAEVVAFRADVVEGRFAVRAGADVVAGVGHVARVGVFEQTGPAVGVRGVEAVFGRRLGFFAPPVGGGRAEVFAPPRADRLLARGGAAVEPDRVAAAVG